MDKTSLQQHSTTSVRLILLFVFLTPAICSAQRWTAIVKGGPLWNSRSSKPVTNEHSSALRAMAAVGAAYRLNAWEGGVLIGLYSYAFQLKGDFVFGPEPGTGRYFTRYRSVTTRLPAVVVMPFINRHFDTGRLSWYAGIAPAYLNFNNPVVYEHALLDNKAVGSHGYALEVHGGCTFRISEAISVFGEPALGVVNMPGYYGRMSMLYGSLAVGLSIGVR